MPDKKKLSFTNIGTGVAKFFSELKSELKKVIWPDRKKLTQSTITVLSICLIMAVIIFVIDNVLAGALGFVGFFPETDSSEAASNLLPTSAPVITDTLIPSGSSSVSSEEMSQTESQTMSDESSN